jgi:hypothetical protein
MGAVRKVHRVPCTKSLVRSTSFLPPRGSLPMGYPQRTFKGIA